MDTPTTAQLDLENVLPMGLHPMIQHAQQYLAKLPDPPVLELTTDHVPYLQRWVCAHELDTIFEIIVTSNPYMPFEYSDLEFATDLMPTDEVRADAEQMTDALTTFMDDSFGSWLQLWTKRAREDEIDALPSLLYAPLGMIPSMAMRSLRMVYQRHKDGTAAYIAIGHMDLEGFQVTVIQHEPYSKVETTDLGDVTNQDA